MNRTSSLGRLLLLLASLVTLGVAGAAGASLGGITSDDLFATSNSIPADAPTVVMADSFTTASGVDGRAPESVGGFLWQEVNGRWVVRNGYLDPPMSPNALVLYPAGLHDLRVEMAVTVTSAHRFGLVARASATGPTYLVASISSSGQAQIAKTVAGTTTVLATAAFVAPLVPFTMSLTVVGSLLELRSDGVLVVSHPLVSGDAAIFAPLTDAGVWVSSSGNERLDDFRITTVT